MSEVPTGLICIGAILVGTVIGMGVASGLFWLTLKLPDRFLKWLGL